MLAGVAIFQAERQLLAQLLLLAVVLEALIVRELLEDLEVAVLVEAMLEELETHLQRLRLKEIMVAQRQAPPAAAVAVEALEL